MILGWLASTFFLGGKASGGLRLLPTLALVCALLLGAYAAGRAQQTWKSAGRVNALEESVSELSGTVTDLRNQHAETVKAIEQAHTLALIERDAEHARQLQAQVTEVSRARAAATENRRRLDALNNRLAEIHRAEPDADPCVSSPRSLRLLEEAGAAANGGGAPR